MLLVSAGNVCCIVLMFLFSLFLLIIISVASMWHVPPLFFDDLFCFVVSFFSFFLITFFLVTFFLCLGLHCYCSSAIPDEANSQCHAMPFDSFNPHPQHCLMDLRLAVLLMCELMASWCRLNDGLVEANHIGCFLSREYFYLKSQSKTQTDPFLAPQVL